MAWLYIAGVLALAFIALGMAARHFVKAIALAKAADDAWQQRAHGDHLTLPFAGDHAARPTVSFHAHRRSNAK